MGTCLVLFLLLSNAVHVTLNCSRITSAFAAIELLVYRAHYKVYNRNKYRHGVLFSICFHKDPGSIRNICRESSILLRWSPLNKFGNIVEKSKFYIYMYEQTRGPIGPNTLLSIDVGTKQCIY